jgi:transposase
MPRKWSIATSVWPTRDFRVLKPDIAIAPMHHRLPERIRAHGLIGFLALLLDRVMRTQLTDHSPTAAYASSEPCNCTA